MRPENRRRFEALCRATGLREYQVIDQVLDQWIRENEAQARLTNFAPSLQQITILTDRVNIVARKAKLLVIKENLARFVRRLDDNRPTENRYDITGLTHLLREELQRAARLPPEARDSELQVLVARAEKHLMMEESLS